jgi:hypothetical protein
MAIDWEIHGWSFGNCNCDYGCPCQFEALPTQGNCSGTNFNQIDEGYFGQVPLSGLKMGAIYSWPGPIHEGKGKCQIFIDSKATDAQREALERISRGEEADEFSNIFCVYAAMCDEIYEPLVTEIEFEMDMQTRSAKCIAHGVCEAAGEPIIGVAGNEHRAQIHLPEGLEYRVAEIGRGRCRSRGNIELKLDDGYAQFSEMHLNRHGVIG